MKPKSGKAKGRTLQKWVCFKVSNLIGLDWGYEDDKDIKPRLMGQSGVDVILSKEARDLFKFDIETKNTEKLNLYDAIQQIKRNLSPGREWLVIHKKNFSQPIAIVDADVFFNLLETKNWEK